MKFLILLFGLAVSLTVLQSAPAYAADRQVFYLENWTVGVRIKGDIRFYSLQGDADWKLQQMDLTNLGFVDQSFYLAKMIVGIRFNKYVFFYRKLGSAPWRKLQDWQFRSKQDMDEVVAIDSNTIGVRVVDTIRLFRKWGNAPWKHVDDMDFVCKSHIDGFIYAGDMTLGIRTGSVLRFYKKLGLAPWGYLEDHDFNIPVAVDDIFYVNDLSVGIRKNNTVNFYWKVGQAPWSLRPVKPFLIADSKTRDFSGMQKYLDPAPLGVDARYAWTILGGKGKGVTIVDIENPLDLDHEDFKPAFWISAGKVNSNGDGWGEHGTSVIGLLIGQHNGFGIDGICPDAEYGVSAVIVPESPGSEDDPTDEAGKIAIAAAIDSAASHLKKGDIILIEQFLSNPTKKDFPAREDCPSAFPGSLPVEYDNRCFDAILRASEKGIIVVEPAANGGVNLDDSLYQGLFSRDQRDSKAIMVGADEGGNRAPACWTNYGSRVDFFSWGNNIVTTGKGDLPFEPFDRHKKYTQSFSGTSGAAPIIAGVIACLQGIQIASGKQLYTADDIRRILIGNAPITESQKLIGLAPNLKETILRVQSQ